MGNLVTIGVPIYNRLEYLPNVLDVVSRQDYPDIELIVSDNGMNAAAVLEIVKRHYSRPFKYRQNVFTVPMCKHFNQIVHAASGKYFVLLQDDDEISPNYVSELVSRLERHPEASVAISKQEIVDESGAKIRESVAELPDTLSGTDFIWNIWAAHKYKLECFATFLAKTEAIKACGGYSDCKKGSHTDNALLIKLSLSSYVAFSPKCSFRWRAYDASHGWSINVWDLAADSRQFLRFLQNDPTISAFSVQCPEKWNELRRILIRSAWRTYLKRWNGIYRNRLSWPEWVAAAFAMPPIPEYYREVAFILLDASKMFALRKSGKA
jgi:glycosyltransferase involved in cell wall biosynthesis